MIIFTIKGLVICSRYGGGCGKLGVSLKCRILGGVMYVSRSVSYKKGLLFPRISYSWLAILNDVCVFYRYCKHLVYNHWRGSNLRLI